MWGLVKGNNINFGGNYSYTYNYFRSYLAYQASGWLFFGYSIIPQMSIVLSGNVWAEWDPDNSLVAVWPLIRPRLDITFSADKRLAIFNEFVLQTPGSNWGETEWISNRFGLLFSWNFMPKSWLYFAINDYRSLEGERLEPQYTIAAIKAKYLVYF
jgi:hypothetical protein